MINRIKAIIDQIKSVSTDRLYFDCGMLYSGRTNMPFQVYCDYKDDKKSKEVLKDKTFFIDVPLFTEWIKNYKKSYTETVFDGNTIIFKSNIPDNDLVFRWEEDENDLELKKFKKNMNKLIHVVEKKQCEFSIEISDSETIKKILEADRLYIKDNELYFEKVKQPYTLIKVIFKKYIGKLLGSTKLFTIEVFQYKENMKIVRLSTLNSSLVSYYYGIIINWTGVNMNKYKYNEYCLNNPDIVADDTDWDWTLKIIINNNLNGFIPFRFIFFLYKYIL